jgi:hypothetical protein
MNFARLETLVIMHLAGKGIVQLKTIRKYKVMYESKNPDHELSVSEIGQLVKVLADVICQRLPWISIPAPCAGHVPATLVEGQAAFYEARSLLPPDLASTYIQALQTANEQGEKGDKKSRALEGLKRRADEAASKTASDLAIKKAKVAKPPKGFVALQKTSAKKSKRKPAKKAAEEATPEDVPVSDDLPRFQPVSTSKKSKEATEVAASEKESIGDLQAASSEAASESGNLHEEIDAAISKSQKRAAKKAKKEAKAVSKEQEQNGEATEPDEPEPPVKAAARKLKAIVDRKRKEKKATHKGDDVEHWVSKWEGRPGFFRGSCCKKAKPESWMALLRFNGELCLAGLLPCEKKPAIWMPGPYMVYDAKAGRYVTWISKDNCPWMVNGFESEEELLANCDDPESPAVPAHIIMKLDEKGHIPAKAVQDYMESQLFVQSEWEAFKANYLPSDIKVDEKDAASVRARSASKRGRPLAHGNVQSLPTEDEYGSEEDDTTETKEAAEAAEGEEGGGDVENVVVSAIA